MPATINRILAHAPEQFLVENLQPLLDFVDAQLKDYMLYNLKCNVAILKLYLLYPDLANVNVYEQILALALGQVLRPDFTIAVAMIPKPMQASSKISRLIKLGALLQKCAFVSFWAKADIEIGSVKLLQVPGFVDNIRTFILDLLPLVYMRIELPQLRSLLNFEKNTADMENLLRHNGYTVFDYNEDDLVGGYATCKKDTPETVKTVKKTTEFTYFKPEALRAFQNSMRA
ncbi:bifunctional CSN8-PSMD8-EIF3K/Proteasome component (PCI) domain/Armadillo-type fold/Eukaryotic translation initiation factor 3 subunit K/Winged helix DNA-binding domain superfamily/Translation initiation factor 3 [Babesia duncani]|uniref:PCI domain-containing protein n=1 Tax=Babesia duncani TaxID=323732 RepID=A0AAD9UM19_9APIC|nr:bifunctional CSN8-PSMD8-EIF3K/Proteasome component (PCI) domain/Armadillo-type fold/Eukaryotic translation initiation factor 3 subunit K/Winged helix DNA-binding domain superfamily/Translation initiation factor 3 [Babesia duncani]KAK2196564.1 bifunctional CSN8-PSMD8-EIF3K/Proteasome component (PCI) domain/Armadillo-type fold/Eukaryotic translation initiation factor 3 subunit K/Winged helix DNA-binding domain superfamily/Translation initiation factor 3 [Babesia duncani]